MYWYMDHFVLSGILPFSSLVTTWRC